MTLMSLVCGNAQPTQTVEQELSSLRDPYLELAKTAMKFTATAPVSEFEWGNDRYNPNKGAGGYYFRTSEARFWVGWKSHPNMELKIQALTPDGLFLGGEVVLNKSLIAQKIFSAIELRKELATPPETPFVMAAGPAVLR